MRDVHLGRVGGPERVEPSDFHSVPFVVKPSKANASFGRTDRHDLGQLVRGRPFLLISVRPETEVDPGGVALFDGRAVVPKGCRVGAKGAEGEVRIGNLLDLTDPAVHLTFDRGGSEAGVCREGAPPLPNCKDRRGGLQDDAP